MVETKSSGALTTSALPESSETAETRLVGVCPEEPPPPPPVSTAPPKPGKPTAPPPPPRPPPAPPKRAKLPPFPPPLLLLLPADVGNSSLTNPASVLESA